MSVLWINWVMIWFCWAVQKHIWVLKSTVTLECPPEEQGCLSNIRRKRNPDPPCRERWLWCRLTIHWLYLKLSVHHHWVSMWQFVIALLGQFRYICLHEEKLLVLEASMWKTRSWEWKQWRPSPRSQWRSYVTCMLISRPPLFWGRPQEGLKWEGPRFVAYSLALREIASVLSANFLFYLHSCGLPWWPRW